MSYHVGLRKNSKRVAAVMLLSFGFNVVAYAVQTTPATGGCFAHVEKVEEKGAINKFYAEYLKNRVTLDRREEQAEQAWKSTQKPSHPDCPKIWEGASTRLLMSHLEKNGPAINTEGCAYFSPNVYTELNVFPDPEKPDKVTVFSDFSNLTTTLAGKLGLLEMLSRPLCELEKLRTRQRVIEFLYRNNAVFGQLDAALKKYGKAESSMMYFLKAQDDGNSPDNFKRYFDDNVWKSNLGWYGCLVGRLAPSTIAAGTGLAISILAPVLYSLNARHINGESSLFEKTSICGIGPLVVALAVSCGYLSYKGYQKIYAPKAEMGKRFQACMINMAEIVEATKNIGEIVSKCDVISSAVQGHREALKFISGGQDQELKALLGLFTSGSFKGEPTAFGPKGKVFKAFDQMCKKADKFVELIRFISRMDAIMAVVKALRMTANSPIRYSIPEFIKPEVGKPSLKAKGFWHSTLDTNKAIPNDIELGKQFRNVILHGANAGGKSTWMQSLALIIVLAQTFGIVPAQAVELTPFTKVIVDIRVKDEIGSKSTFQAEIDKLTSSMKEIKELHDDQFAFYIVDEPLKGSNAQDCAKIARGVIEDLGSSTNALLVVASHHPELTEIAATNNSFKNYRVHSTLFSAEVEDPNTGKIKTEYAWKHTYKVVPGIEKNRFAIALLKDALEKTNLDFSASNDLLAK